MCRVTGYGNSIHAAVARYPRGNPPPSPNTSPHTHTHTHTKKKTSDTPRVWLSQEGWCRQAARKSGGSGELAGEARTLLHPRCKAQCGPVCGTDKGNGVQEP
eukprot:389610-Rhodomonas_salina.1